MLIKNKIFLFGMLVLLFVSESVMAGLNKGVMIHFLPTISKAKDRVGKIDLDELFRNIGEVGADYFVFTLGQNKGQYLFRSNALLEACPIYKERDIGNYFLDDLMVKAKSKNIKIIFYIPFRAPQFDSEMMSCLRDVPERQPTTEQFLNNWANIIDEISMRYGESLAGWWLDGAYNVTGISTLQWNGFCRALYAGNKNRVVAFNSGEGLKHLDDIVSPCQSLSAGEMNNITSLDFNNFKFPENIKPHVLSRIANGWGKNDIPQFDCKKLKNVTEQLNAIGGMLTIDINFNEDYGFRSDQLSLLKSAWVENCGELK